VCGYSKHLPAKGQRKLRRRRGLALGRWNANRCRSERRLRRPTIFPAGRSSSGERTGGQRQNREPANTPPTTGDVRRYNGKQPRREPDRRPLQEISGVRALWNTNAREVPAGRHYEIPFLTKLEDVVVVGCHATVALLGWTLRGNGRERGDIDDGNTEFETLPTAENLDTPSLSAEIVWQVILVIGQRQVYNRMSNLRLCAGYVMLNAI